jgi:hypothetical protein
VCVHRVFFIIHARKANLWCVCSSALLVGTLSFSPETGTTTGNIERVTSRYDTRLLYYRQGGNAYFSQYTTRYGILNAH